MNLEDMNKRIPEASQALPSLDELTGMSTSQAHARLQRLEQHAVVEMDGASLLRCLSLHDELAAEEPDEQLARDLAHAWSALYVGDRVAHDLSLLERRAAQCGSAERVIEAATLRALVASTEGELQRATALARRASRMARVEGLMDSEILANLVLARIRRQAGTPHLAARIASALGRACPPAYRGWIAWELALAGEPERAAPLLSEGDAVVQRAGRALLAMLGAARVGERSAFEASAESLSAQLPHCVFLRDEAEQLRAAIDPQVPLESLVGELQEWCAGRRNDPPVALTGWCVESPSGGAPAYVTNRSAGGPRRILGLGLGLLAATPSAAGKSAGTRRDTALAVLLLAGREGLDDEAFFSATYGFALTSSSHRSALHVLTHRLRAQLPEGVRLVRIDDRNRLETSSGVSVPDPRCGRRTTDRVLRALAGRGASAKEVASSLGIGVRTAQKVLQELVDEGSCLTRKEGRRVTYIVEDTTFEEPTQRGPA